MPVILNITWCPVHRAIFSTLKRGWGTLQGVHDRKPVGLPVFPQHPRCHVTGQEEIWSGAHFSLAALVNSKKQPRTQALSLPKLYKLRTLKKKKKGEYAARWELHVLYSYVAHCQDAGSLSSMPLTTWNQHLNKHVVILFAQLTSVSESSEDDRKPLSSLA